jgi:hypothetical protein
VPGKCKYPDKARKAQLRIVAATGSANHGKYGADAHE